MRGPRGKRHGAPRPGPEKAGPEKAGPEKAGPEKAGPDAAAVVVGLDGSDTSWDAFWWACGEARRLGGRLVAVFVSSSTEASMVAMTSSVAGVAVYDCAAVEQATSAQALRLRAEVQGLSDGLDVAFVHTRGDPARELLRVAEGIRADMIVVGRSAKARHQIAGSLGCCLITRRRSLIVVVVP